MVAPGAINATWLDSPGRRFGGVAADATGQGPFSVWRSGNGAAGGRCEVAVSGAHAAIGTAHGVQVLSEAKPVTAVQSYDIVFLGGKPALETLQQAYTHTAGAEPLPLHRLMAGIADSAEDIRHGRYRLSALVCANEQDRSVTLSRQVKPGQLIFWALRDADVAQHDLQQALTGLQSQLGAQPEFGLMFSCLGRGPHFYSGVDKDLDLVRKALPGMPLIGFYGNGEIAPMNGINELLQYSAVLGLFHEPV
jgi:small ligand-binding sensory domain FIST